MRSLSPAGTILEARTEGAGFRFNAPGANALVIDEVGVQRPFSPNGHQIWLRAGAIYNFSEYPEDDGRTARNWGGYALADYQLTKFDTDKPYRGVFVGGTLAYGTPQVNAFSQYAEARAYTIGLFDSRPSDVDSVVTGFNVFSKSIRRRLDESGVATAPSQFNLGLAHTFHALHGVYVSPGLVYSDHPSFTGRYKSALNTTVSLILFY